MAIYYIGFPLLVLIAIIDSTLMHVFRMWGGVPSLLIIVIVSWTLMVELHDALPWAVMGGIFHDLLSVVPTGTSAVLLTLLVVLIDVTFPKLQSRNIIVPPFLVLFITFIYNFGIFMALAVVEMSVPLFWGMFYIVLPAAVMNALMTPFVFRALGVGNNFFRPQRTTAAPTYIHVKSTLDR